jgi:hypothetical protein
MSHENLLPVVFPIVMAFGGMVMSEALAGFLVCRKCHRHP